MWDIRKFLIILNYYTNNLHPEIFNKYPNTKALDSDPYQNVRDTQHTG